MPREDLSRNLVDNFFPDLERKIKGIFKEVKYAGGSFKLGNIIYTITPHGNDILSADYVYRKLIELYSTDCKVEADEYEDMFDEMYVICDNHKVCVRLSLGDNQLSVSAWATR